MNKRNAVVQKSGSPAPERPQFSLIDEELLKSLNIPAKINRHSGMAETARPEYRKPL